MRYEEPSEHCLCDKCSGQDCGQDNPEEYEREKEKERSDIRQAEREKVLDEAIKHWERVIENGKGVAYNHPITYEWMYRGVVDYLKELRQEGKHD